MEALQGPHGQPLIGTERHVGVRPSEANPLSLSSELGHTGDTPGGMNSEPQFEQRKPLVGELAGMPCSAALRPDEASPKARETDRYFELTQRVGQGQR